MSTVLGVDIGGSHITAGWVDLQKATVLHETVKRASIDSKASAESIIDGWSSLLEFCIKDNQYDNIRMGIAMPGPFDYVRGVSLIKEQDKFKNLYGMNIRQLLSERLSVEPQHFRFINDAESYLLGEVLGGAGKGFPCVLGLTLGTGLGSAIHSQKKTSDADLWRMPFKESIAEDYLSTSWFVKRYYALAGRWEPGLKEILANAETNILDQLFAEFVQNLSDFLMLAAEVHHVEAVVIGGNISLAHSFFFTSLKKLMAKQVHNMTLVLGTLGEEAILIGAAGQWKEQMSEKYE